MERTASMRTITDDEFGELIHGELRDFLSLSAALASLTTDKITKPFVGRLLLEASKCEELLDAFGASLNEYWAPMRMGTALTKAFSQVCYNLMHIRQFTPDYQLPKVKDDFISRTEEVLVRLLDAFQTTAEDCTKLAHSMKLDHELRDLESYNFKDPPFGGHLTPNCSRKKGGLPHEMAVYLATNLLNLTEQGDWLDVYQKTDPEDYHTCIPDQVSEENFRNLSNNVHNLQSMYDTHLSGCDLTESDSMLPVMRGQISVVFHLLDTGVTLIHLYERHSTRRWNKTLKIPITDKDLLQIVIGYFVAFADQYIEAAQELCRQILKSYAVQGEIEVPIPNYRGFHVRPSTLIAKIVHHYGSAVQMILGSSKYNAAMPLELFRANEELNRRKRNSVILYAMEHKLMKSDAGVVYDASLMKKILRVIFLDLLEKQKIMLYDGDLSFEDLSPQENETLAEFIKRAIAMYLATGKIDIISSETVRFEGDKRVLEDIRILAENGYGEDKYGNNIVLPPLLSYLKR